MNKRSKNKKKRNFIIINSSINIIISINNRCKYNNVFCKLCSFYVNIYIYYYIYSYIFLNYFINIFLQKSLITTN